MYNILVCDDEKDIVSALEIYLTADGYQIFTAYNGRQAVDILNKEEIHLVLMDIMMPEMNGISAMVKIREKSNVPVILLTAKSEDTDKILGLTVGTAGAGKITAAALYAARRQYEAGTGCACDRRD